MILRKCHDKRCGQHRDRSGIRILPDGHIPLHRMTVSFTGDSQDDKARKEGIPVVEPCIPAHAVPDNIQKRILKTDQQNEEQSSVYQFFPARHPAADKEDSCQKKRNRSRIDQRRIIGQRIDLAGKQSGKDRRKSDQRTQVPDTFEKIHRPSRRQAEKAWKQHRHGDARTQHGSTRILHKRCLETCTKPVFRKDQFRNIKHHRTDTQHIADVKIGDQRKRKRCGIKTAAFGMYQPADPRIHHWQQDHPVHPGGIPSEVNHVSHQPVTYRRQGFHACPLFRIKFLQAETECQRRTYDLQACDKMHRRDHMIMERDIKKIERAERIVRKLRENISAEHHTPGIQQIVRSGHCPEIMFNRKILVSVRPEKHPVPKRPDTGDIKHDQQCA